MFIDNTYVSPQLLAIVDSDWSVRAVSTCRENQIFFDSESLKLENKVEMVSFIRLMGNQPGMVICRWKGSKVLQTVSTVMKLGCQEVQRINIQN